MRRLLCAVVGLMIAAIYGPTSFAGEWLEQRGIAILYDTPGIVLAMLFVTMPFTIRALQPVLMEWEREQEEAAFTLGAGAWTRSPKIARWPAGGQTSFNGPSTSTHSTATPGPSHLSAPTLCTAWADARP